MAQHRHKRETARRKPTAALIAGPLAVLATGAAVTIGVLGSDADQLLAVDATSAAGSAADAATGDRGRKLAPLSRSANRPVIKRAPLSPVEKLLTADAVAKAVARAEKQVWTTEELNLWTAPDDTARQVGVLGEGKKVVVTGRTFGEREEIVLEGDALWVTAGYLSAEKPEPGPSLEGECTNGTSVASGVSASIVEIHQAVCANWPEVTSYGTLRADSGDHGSGRAIDVMVSGPVGWEIAEFLRTHYSDFGISYIIYEQQIWSVERGGEGWRGMEDRGSFTANHFDHVHVTTY